MTFANLNIEREVERGMTRCQELKLSAAGQQHGMFAWAIAEARRGIDTVIIRQQ